MPGWYNEFGQWVDDPSEVANSQYAVTGAPRQVLPAGQLPAGQSIGPQVAKRSVNPITSNNATAIQTNNQVLGQLSALPGQIQGAREYADAYDRYAIQQGQQLGGATFGALGANTAAGYQNAQNANAAGQSYLTNLGNIYGGLSAGALGSNQNYQNTLSGIRAAPYVGIQSGAADVNRQMGALNMLGGIAGGSLDYQAAQAQASLAPAHQDIAAAQGYAQTYTSNGADIARQQQSYDDLMRVGQGGLDYRSQAARAYADPAMIAAQERSLADLTGVSRGSLDQQSLAAAAAADPGAVQRQMQGIDKLWGLTDPSITAQERFMMETARREQEQGDRAARGAVMADLSARGFSGSGAQQTDMLGAQERNAQNRTLADLGAQANAQARATAALGLYVDATSTLRSQTFDEAFKRAAAGDMMAVENANRRLQAMGMSADQANMMRDASFREAYARGVAADTAAANNQQTRLQGIGMAANQANAIRSANDAVGTFNTAQKNQMEAFNVGQRNTVSMHNSAQRNAVNTHNSSMQTQTNISNAGFQNQAMANNQQTRAQGAANYATQTNAIRDANDAILRFNKEQSMIQSRFDTDTQIGIADRRFEADKSTRTEIGDYASNFTDMGLRENDAAAGRNQTAISNEGTNIGRGYQVGRDMIGDLAGYGQNTFNRTIGGAQTVNSIGSTVSDIGGRNAQLANEGPRMQMAQSAFDKALAASQPQDPSASDKFFGALSFGHRIFDPLGIGQDPGEYRKLF